MNVTHRTITLKDGRKLRLVEAGQADGIPVIELHGTPDSRLLFDRWVEDAQARGLRLISYDRPGYGGSSPHPDWSVAAAEMMSRRLRKPWA